VPALVDEVGDSAFEQGRVERLAGLPADELQPERLSQTLVGLVLENVELAGLEEDIVENLGGQLGYMSHFDFVVPVQRSGMCWRWHKAVGILQFFQAFMEHLSGARQIDGPIPFQRFRCPKCHEGAT